MALKDDFLYEIAKAAGFVTSRDFTDGRFSSVIRSHGGQHSVAVGSVMS